MDADSLALPFSVRPLLLVPAIAVRPAPGRPMVSPLAGVAAVSASQTELVMALTRPVLFSWLGPAALPAGPLRRKTPTLRLASPRPPPSSLVRRPKVTIRKLLDLF